MATLERKKIGPLSILRGGRGPALLLLHGIPGSAYAWEAVAEQLAGTFDVIVPDLLGFGASDEPRGDYYMEAQASALFDLVQALGVGPLVLGGHDFGGPVAVTLLRQFPQLSVRGLLLTATNLFTDTFVPLPLRAAPIPVLGSLVFHAMAGSRPAFWMMYRQAARNTAEATWERFSRHLTRGGMRRTRQIFQRSLADLEGNYAAVEEMLPKIAVPSLVVWGDGDPFFAVSVGERTHRSIRGSKLKVYEGTGHFVPEERPKRLADDIVQAFAK